MSQPSNDSIVHDCTDHTTQVWVSIILTREARRRSARASRFLAAAERAAGGIGQAWAQRMAEQYENHSACLRDLAEQLLAAAGQASGDGAGEGELP